MHGPAAAPRPVALAPMSGESSRSKNAGRVPASPTHRPEWISRPATVLSNCSSRWQARHPAEVRAGLGGFGGLFALRGGYGSRCWGCRPTGWGPNSPPRRRLTRHDTVGSTWSPWRWTTWRSPGPSPCSSWATSPSGRTVPERDTAIVSGIAEGCARAGCALIGGETAEHPGLYPTSTTAATAVGVVEADESSDRSVRPGEVTRGGLHRTALNGDSLARKVLFEIDR